MQETTKERGRKLIRPLVRVFVNFKVSPMVVTFTAVPLSILAAFLFANGFFLWAGVVVLLVGLCDTIDGELSRLTGKVSSTGAFLDSTIDRFSEGVIFTGIGWYYSAVNHRAVLLVLITLLFSFLVSYVRARAEGVGKESQIGFFERPVRVGILALGALILGRSYLLIALAVIAIGSFVTFVQRFIYVLKQS